MEEDRLQYEEMMSQALQISADCGQLSARATALNNNLKSDNESFTRLEQGYNSIAGSLTEVSQLVDEMDAMLLPLNYTLAFASMISDLSVSFPSLFSSPSSSSLPIPLTLQEVLSEGSQEEKDKIQTVFEGWDDSTFSLCKVLVSHLRSPSEIGALKKEDRSSLMRTHIEEAGRSVLMDLDISPFTNAAQLSAIVSTLERLYLTKT